MVTFQVNIAELATDLHCMFYEKLLQRQHALQMLCLSANQHMKLSCVDRLFVLELEPQYNEP